MSINFLKYHGEVSRYFIIMLIVLSCNLLYAKCNPGDIVISGATSANIGHCQRNTCPEDYTLNDSVCIKCEEGYTFTYGLCYKQCNPGFEDLGIACKNKITNNIITKKSYVQPKILPLFYKDMTWPLSSYYTKHEPACLASDNIISSTKLSINDTDNIGDIFISCKTVCDSLDDCHGFLFDIKTKICDIKKIKKIKCNKQINESFMSKPGLFFYKKNIIKSSNYASYDNTCVNSSWHKNKINTYEHGMLGIRGFEACTKQCDNNSKCDGFSFHALSKKCFFIELDNDECKTDINPIEGYLPVNKDIFYKKIKDKSSIITVNNQEYNKIIKQIQNLLDKNISGTSKEEVDQIGSGEITGTDLSLIDDVDEIIKPAVIFNRLSSKVCSNSRGQIIKDSYSTPFTSCIQSCAESESCKYVTYTNGTKLGQSYYGFYCIQHSSNECIKESIPTASVGIMPEDLNPVIKFPTHSFTWQKQ